MIMTETMLEMMKIPLNQGEIITSDQGGKTNIDSYLLLKQVHPEVSQLKLKI